MNDADYELRPGRGILCCLLLMSSAHAASQNTNPAGVRITALEQSYAASRNPALKFLLAEDYAQIGERDRALAALRVVAQSRRGFLPPEYSPLWRYSEDPAFAQLLSQLRASLPPTSRGVVAHLLKGATIVPEGLAFDSRAQRILIGDMYRRRVYAVREDGLLEPLISQLSLQPLGMSVDVARNRLWVATNNANTAARSSRSELVSVDLETRKHRSISDPRAMALNDVTVAANGDVYTSDFGSGAVFRLRAGSDRLDAVLEPGSLSFPNGLTLDDSGRYLFVSQGLRVMRVDLQSGVSLAVEAPADLDTVGTDGLYYRDGALYGVQNVVTPGRIVRMQLADDLARIVRFDVLDSVNPHFDAPTTGAFVGEKFIVIANSQIHRLSPDGVLDVRNLKPIMLLGYETGVPGAAHVLK